MNGRELQLERLRSRHRDAAICRFGDSRELCDELLALVRSGCKRATCGALRDFGPDIEPMPVVGRCDIACDWDGWPALVIEMVEVTLQRFCDVTEVFALAEGEADDLAGWQRGHRAYFERNGGWEPELMLVCEHFRLVEDLARAEDS